MQIGDKLTTISGEHIDMVKLAEAKLSPNLPNNVELVETEIVSIEVKTSILVGFNAHKGTEKRYSVTQPMLVQTEDGVSYKNAGDIQLGDVLVGVLEDGKVLRDTVESIEIDETESEVYDIRTAPLPWFIADTLMVIT
jgi:hypothetical protein